ncbi:response regulator transcription factor [Jeotgalibacillus terrae]|uniref:Response regulator n=1 Tax=Jeotgalibacillus terrae TaxID=587735 RepID=A0ABW5ZC50_9BACL|nr:response regulator [Jeotgalibacillus terrae]MBM7580146.1 YesN/AraC family two-component response regulator [Jeotgalibacillus terrae]
MDKERTILLVDDEETTLRGLTKSLEVWADGRYMIRSAGSAEEAIQTAQQEKVHVIVTDICMPEMTGLELIEEIQRLGQKPVSLILSGHSEFEFAQTAIRLGVLNYLVKPVQKKKLIQSVEEALEKEFSEERAGIMQKAADHSLTGLEQDQKQMTSPVQAGRDYIDNHMDRQMTIREVAEHVHLNPSYFSVIFKEQTGLTFSEYVTRKRLQKAKHLLLTTSMPVADIAESAGYQTAKYFNKIFKEYEGITPGRFRKHHN